MLRWLLPHFIRHFGKKYSNFKISMWSFLWFWIVFQRIKLLSKFLYLYPLNLRKPKEPRGCQYGSLPYLTWAQHYLWVNRNPEGHNNGEGSRQVGVQISIQSVESFTINFWWWEPSWEVHTECSGLLRAVLVFKSTPVNYFSALFHFKKV